MSLKKKDQDAIAMILTEMWSDTPYKDDIESIQSRQSNMDHEDKKHSTFKVKIDPDFLYNKPFNEKDDEFKTIYTFEKHDDGQITATDTSNTGNNFIVKPFITIIDDDTFEGYSGGRPFTGVWRKGVTGDWE